MTNGKTNVRIYLQIAFAFCVLAFVVGIIVYQQKNQKQLCKDCNVLFISIDTLSAKHVPCYGYFRDTAPNLCRFAQKNVLFTNAYVNSSWTLPSHVSMLTGLYPMSHQVIRDDDSLSPSIPFLPEILQKGGYETLFFIPPNDYTLPIDRVFNRGISRIVEEPLTYMSTEYNSMKPYFQNAMQQLLDNNNAGKKTFLFLHTYYVHDPYFIDDRYALYTNDRHPNIALSIPEVYGNYSDGFYRYLLTKLPQDIPRMRFENKRTLFRRYYQAIQAAGTTAAAKRITDRYTRTLGLNLFDYYQFYYWDSINSADDRQMAYLVALYDQKIHELDAFLEEIFRTIETTPLRNNTVVIITSDHGEEFMEHGSTTHTSLYEEVVRVPLIFSVPGIQSVRRDDYAQSIDLVPTLLDMLGFEENGLGTYQGVNLFPRSLLGGVEKRMLLIDGQYSKERVLRDGKWKLFINMDNGKTVPYALYDTESDPGEQKNLFGSHMAKVEEMMKAYEKESPSW